MNRFRKKSDAKRGPFAVQVSSSSVSSVAPALDTALPALPEINDFRTSLILPNLGKRFSILRNAQGHSTLESLRSKFAEQRAKGADNHITEEEEEMMLEALAGISKGTSTTPSRVADEEELDYLGDYYTSSRTSSTPSSSTATTVYPRSSAATDSPQSQRTSKRNSSNLFGSGRFRDQSYIRSARERVTSQTSSISSPRDRLMSLDGSNSASMTAAMTRETSSSTLASVPEPGTDGSSSRESGGHGGKDSDKTPVAKLLSLGPSSPAPEAPRAAALSPAQQRRMSRALESALLELTGGAMPEEDDDIIVAPRSARSPPPPTSPRAANGPASPRPPPLQRDLFNNIAGAPHAPQPPQSSASDTASDFMRGDDDPFASYKRVEDLINRNGAAPSPGPTPQRAPVSPSSMYIPGMQRPTSPRDVASFNHEQRADSTTPRATQPQSPTFRGFTAGGRAPNAPPHLPASILSRSALPRSDSPAFGMHQPTHSKSSSFGSLADLGRFRMDSPGPEREPVSILKQTRPLSPPTSGRTPTPVNASRDGGMPAWLANANYYQQHISRGATPEYGQASTPGHSRRGSALSDESDPYGTSGMRGRNVIGGHQRTKSNASARSLTSPALPDSPLIDGTAGVDYGSLTGAWDLDARVSSLDIGRSAADLAAQTGRPSTPRSPPFLARSPSLTRSPSQTRGYDSDYSIGRQQFSSTPPPGPTPGLGRPRTPSRSNHHSPASSASSSFNNIHSAASNPLVLSPFNASAASVASAGSSYHSEPGDEVEEKLYALLHPGNKKRKWDDFTGELPGTARLTLQFDEQDGPVEKSAEEVLKGLTGLTKDDIVIIQTQLLNAALQMKSTVDPPPSRPPSLRRRRGSIGQTMGVQSPSRTTSPGPVSPHVSPKTSQSPFNASNGHPLAALGAAPASTPSAPPSSSSGSSAAILPSAPPAAPLSPSSPPHSAANLTGSDTEREKTPAPRPNDRGARANALLTSMMDSIDSKKPAQALASPGYARPLSPQLQGPARAMSPIPAASIAVSPARAKSPPLMRAKSPPADSPVRARSPVQQQQPQQPTAPHHEPQSSQSSDLSSIMRNQALADAIFGVEEDHPVSAAQAQELLATSPVPPEEDDHRYPSPPPAQRVLASPSPVQLRYGSPPPDAHQRYGSPSPVPHEYSPSPDQGYSPSPNKHSYNSASPLPPDDAQLEQDVRRKVELATQQLKQSSSQVSLRPRSDSVRRKKIDPNKIGSPHLVAASTSLENMPSLSPSRSQVALSPSEPRSAGSKFSQRFKKLGWRNKPSTPNSDEPPPPFGYGAHPNMHTPTSASTLHPQVQTVRINPTGMGAFNGPASASLADVSQYKFPPTSPGYSPQSPPASAGPAFKSFMSKFAKPFGASSTDLTGLGNSRDREHLSPHSPIYGSARSPTSPTTPTAFGTSGRTEQLRRGTPPPKHVHPAGTPTSPLAGDSFARGRPSMDDAQPTPKSPELAFKQILDGAAQVGLNPTQMEELTAFLSRSLSTSSRATAGPQTQSPTLTRNNSTARPISPPAPERKPTVRAARTRSPGPITRSARDDNTRSVVVRRTIYLTTDNRPILPPEANPSISRRPSHRKQGSEGGLSTRSGKSVQERVNTPPPRSGTMRFSTEAPPIPMLSATYLDATVPGAAGASTSSLVDPYGAVASIAPSERDRFSARSPYPASVRNGEHGGEPQQQALEVLEFADGRVVWQIVDGLRAAEEDNFDGESEFRSRASFDSGYSMGEREPELQLQMREHKRMPSKSSATSSTFNRKSTYNRPETKVFYTDQEQIGRLIENMTRGMNSGSFNVVPAVPTLASGTASETQSTQDLTWTMEEHLEHVLGSLNHRPTSP